MEDYEDLATQMGDLEAVLDLAGEESDGDEVPEELAEEVERLAGGVGRTLERLEEQRLFTGEFDAGDAIVSIHPGAGGTESQDWPRCSFVCIYAGRRRAGLPQSSTRLRKAMRLASRALPSPYMGRTPTGCSPPSVESIAWFVCPRSIPRRDGTPRLPRFDVTPLIEGEVELDIDEKDLRVETYRSSGAGGQHVNKTDSAVRITHIPTKTVVQCQNERSQIQNRETAMRMLRSKLLLLDYEMREQEMAREKGEHKEIAWGSQIRSYVLAPYTLVKDHRTNFEKGNVEAVLDGAIDEFIREYVWQRSTGKLGARQG
jgi:peptide chain release factor 2